jgi:hypothetical protein
MGLSSSASVVLASASRSVGTMIASQQRLIDEVVAAGAKEGALTEAQLSEELGIENSAPRPTRQASSTIAWWQDRQVSLNAHMGIV